MLRVRRPEWTPEDNVSDIHSWLRAQYGTELYVCPRPTLVGTGRRYVSPTPDLSKVLYRCVDLTTC